MFGSNTIEIIIGIVLVFILVSTICTAIREGIEAVLKTRAAYLEQGLRELLNDTKGTGLTKEIYAHPLISGLFNGRYVSLYKKTEKDASSVPDRKLDDAADLESKTDVSSDFENNKNASPDLFASGKNLPSYIPAKNFARALIDIAVRGGTDTTTQSTETISIDTIRQRITNLNNPNIQRVLLNAVDMAQGNLLQVEANIQNWFDSSMDRVSGWYKRSTSFIIFLIGMAVAVSMNVNVFRIVDYLSKNDTARKVLVEQAGILNSDSTAMMLSYQQADTLLKDLRLPIGWTNKNAFKLNSQDSGFWNDFLGPILGWFFTALAATLGAPYWFDVLNKVMVIRSTVKPHEKSGEEASQDTREKPVKQAADTVTPEASPGSEKDKEEDCCGVPFEEKTPDKDLPASKGGVEL